MIFLDVQTVIFINIITDFLCILVLVSLWLQNRKRFKGTFFWVVDVCFQTAALFLIAQRGNIPDWISMILSNTLVVSGALLGYMGLVRFVEKKISQVHNYILLGLFIYVHIYYAFINPNLAARNINVSLGLLVICFQCMWFIFHRAEPSIRKMTQGTGIVFGGFCLASLVRVAVILLSPQSTNDFFRSDIYQMFIIITYQVLLILLSYSLTLMVNHRLLIQIHTQEEKFSKAFHSAPYAITLTGLDDGHILEVNDGFVNITGYHYSEVIGKTTIGLQFWANSEDREAVAGELIRHKRVREAEYQFRQKSGNIIFGLFSAEIIRINDVPCVLSVIMDITERKYIEDEREKLITKLEGALSQIKKLSGLLPICSHCKKIRDDKGYWNQIEAYIQDHSEAEFSHGICRECAQKYYPDMDLYES
ncbi:MAG: PAS domain S-box protein [Proteobacteria bacterium]|nr:PAS domain S-box protein [Pseudomonadota bacterium]